MRHFYERKEFIDKFSKDDYKEFKFLLLQEISDKIKTTKKITIWMLAISLINLLVILAHTILML